MGYFALALHIVGLVSLTRGKSGWFVDMREWNRHFDHRLAMGTHSWRDHTNGLNTETPNIMIYDHSMIYEWRVLHEQSLHCEQKSGNRHLKRLKHKAFSAVRLISNNIIFLLYLCVFPSVPALLMTTHPSPFRPRCLWTPVRCPCHQGWTGSQSPSGPPLRLGPHWCPYWQVALPIPASSVWSGQEIQDH